MNKKLITALFVIALHFTAIVGIKSQQSPRKNEHPQLWAAMSINEPLFQEKWTKNLTLHFTLVNDGSKVLDTETLIGNSRIIVNGEEMKDSAFIFSNGPRSAEWKALPPGGAAQFSRQLGEYFQKPGEYKISWKGNEFETLPVVFRIMPR